MQILRFYYTHAIIISIVISTSKNLTEMILINEKQEITTTTQYIYQ